MAFRQFAVQLNNSSPTLIFTASAGDVEVWLDADETTDYYIGNSSVTANTGLHLNGHGVVFNSHVRPGDELYGISASLIDVNVLIRSA